jgi:hypothetical protein
MKNKEMNSETAWVVGFIAILFFSLVIMVCGLYGLWLLTVGGLK